ncbi:PAS domain-containing protein [Hydrogenophaga sp.]|uniref:PAS domain-containing protein n=1 Tax=Hydrogenophaga sp. TaxID=1904254 RepID=UPI002FCB0804
MSTPIPANEPDRLAALRRLQILDTLPQKAFDSITSLAAGICGTPIALISLVDSNRQWFKSRLGTELAETSRDEAFCAHAVMEPSEVLVVNDASRDARFQNFPRVRNGELVFYAGAPIVTSGGAALGTVCVLDTLPRKLDEEQLNMLKHLADLAMQLIEHERSRREQSEHMVEQILKGKKIIRDVLNEGRDMAAFIDLEHRYLFVNPAFQRYWTLQPQEIMGMQVQDLIDPTSYHALFKPSLDQALAGHESQFALELDFPGMGMRYLEFTHTPARDGGVVHGVVERARDITARKHSERQLDEAVQELQAKRLANRKYVYSVSHDLKEPVNAITNATLLLAEGAALRADPLETRCVRIAQEASAKLSRVLEDLRLYSEVDTGDMRMQPHLAHSIYAGAITEIDAELGAAGVEVELSVEGTIRADAPLLSLAIRSILENLLSSADRQGTVPGVSVVLIRSQEELFTHRVDIMVQRRSPVSSTSTVAAAATTRRPMSARRTRKRAMADVRELGLGLSIASHIIDLHQGELQIELRSDGANRYSVILPGPNRAIELQRTGPAA